jgi:hypothetical protein
VLPNLSEGQSRESSRRAAGGVQSFLASAAGQRSEIENSRTYPPKFKQKILTNFDEQESHLDRLRKYFREQTLDEWLK